MGKILLCSVVLLLEGVWQVRGHRVVQPCGPKLCEALCHKSNCSADIFDEIQLSCQLIMEKTTLNSGCHTSQKGGAGAGELSADQSMQRKNASNTKKSGRGCSSMDLQRFRIACSQRNLQEMEKLISQGRLDVNCRDIFGRTLVMLTVVVNWTEGFDLLVQQNCDLTARDPINKSVMHFACEEGASDIVRKLLIDHCGDIECRDNGGNTPLVVAVHHGRVQVVELLKDRGADMTTMDIFNNTILHHACWGGHVVMVKYVLALKLIDIECRGYQGRTALMTAVYYGHVSVVKILLKHNAKVTTLDEDKANVLHIACSGGDLAMVKLLVALEELRGFEKRKDNDGGTPIEQAEKRGYSKIVTLLKSRTG